MPTDRRRTSAAGQSEEGGPASLQELFAQHRDRLRLVVALRLDRRLQGRFDPSDVIQDAYLEAVERYADYRNAPALSPYLWLRFLTVQRLLLLHRQHLQVQARDAGREVSLDPAVTPGGLAAHLAASTTTPSQAVLRAEREAYLQEALGRMEPADRAILALRHFEQLSNAETAAVLSLRPGTASVRYFRALKRLKAVLRDMPGPLAEGEL
jgi:RNA polymerase sigma-70 factor (ECF subfamily)